MVQYPANTAFGRGEDLPSDGSCAFTEDAGFSVAVAAMSTIVEDEEHNRDCFLLRRGKSHRCCRGC